MIPRKCPRCGKVSNADTDFCIYCGTYFDDENNEDIISIFQIKQLNKDENKETEIFPFNTMKDPNQKEIKVGKINSNQGPLPNSYKILIIIGYVLAVLGGAFGFIVSIFLITRKDPQVKQHGWMQLSILVCWVLLLAALIFSGQMDLNILLNPMNMTQMENMTNLSSSLAGNSSIFGI